MTRQYPDLSNGSDWSCRARNLIQPIRGTTQIWVMTRHQYGISALVSQTSFGGETGGSVTKCRLFSQAKIIRTLVRRHSQKIFAHVYLTPVEALSCQKTLRKGRLNLC